jgi:hypothetical protein
LAVPLILDTIEKTSFSTWLRETPSPFGFYFILTLHTIGLSFLVGPNAAVDLRILGVAPRIPLPPLKNWFKIMWSGFALNATTGLFLLCAYPTKSLTNPVFYLKITLIGLSAVVMRKIQLRVFGDHSLSETAMIERGKTLARASLALWVGAITAGRLLAYTYTFILYGVKG